MLAHQIPRNSLLWLLFSLVWTLIPHLQHLPGWVVFAGAVIFFWRWRIYRGIWAMPGKLVKTTLVLVCAYGIWRGYGSWRGVEPMTGLLLVGMLLKLLEMKSRRDALLVVFLGYFAAATQLLFSQMLLDSIYTLISVWWLLAAQQLLFSGAQMRVRQTLKFAGILLAQAVPVMLVLFVMLPRTGTLWAMPSHQQAARTGMSDSMSPGDVVSLTKSGQVAFRVDFKDATPPPAERYWRGLVLSVFDGRRWSQRSYDVNPGVRGIDLNSDTASSWRAAAQDPEQSEIQYRYQLLMEPSHQRWLFTFGVPISIESRARWAITVDQTLMTLTPMAERQRFDIVSAQRSITEGSLHPFLERHYLTLPEGFNPKTLALARRWSLDSHDPKVIIERFNRWITAEFTYTLQPPGLGRDSVDEFLFTSKQGFCEHFASSFVVFARAAGIPARVVTGYQGGELGLDDDYLLVHQMDAHAWSEVWIDGQWLRVDPTAAVAPERIEKGLRESMSGREELLGEPLSLMRFSHIRWLNNARLQWDMVNYYWQKNVVEFDEPSRAGVLARWFGEMEPWRMGLVFLAGAGSPILLLGFWMYWKGRPLPLSPTQRLLADFERRLVVGDRRRTGETLGDFFSRLGKDHPEKTGQLAQISRLFEKLLYSSVDQQRTLLTAIRHQIMAFRLKANKPTADAETPKDLP